MFRCSVFHVPLFRAWIVWMAEGEGEELARIGGQKEDEGSAEMVRCKQLDKVVNTNFRNYS